MRRLPRHRGFTLIELLVVLVIIGITVGIAMLSMGDGGRGRLLDTESRRLASLLELATEEAVLQSAILGFWLTEDGYGFMRLEGEKWRPLEDHLFRERRLPPDMAFDLSVEGVPAQLAGPGGKAPEEPQVLILSSGELSGFELRIERQAGGSYYAIAGSPVGRLELKGPLGGA